MGSNNDYTLQIYEEHIQDYINGTQQVVIGATKAWLEAAVADRRHDTRILELGSGFGRDADYLQSLGYTVECTDAAVGFVEVLRQKGHDARLLNAIKDDIAGPNDVILANAVLLHFTRRQMETVLSKIFASLNDGGHFAFTLKQGVGEAWSEEKLQAPRYFCYWTGDQIRQYLTNAGFSKLDVQGDIATPGTTWLHIIAGK